MSLIRCEWLKLRRYSCIFCWRMDATSCARESSQECIVNRQELLKRLKGHEWTDVEFKEARQDVPKSAYETV